jgi:DNA-binding MarR family transcriptional regulator
MGMNRREILDDTMQAWRRERPDLDLDAMGSSLRLSQFMHLGLVAMDKLLAPHRVTVGEFDVLAALRRGGAGATRTPTTLARVAMVSPSGMTNRLDRLEAAGLIVRRPDPDDRRGSLVELTAEGVELVDRAVEDVAAAHTAMFEVLRPGDRQRLDRMIDTLLDHLDPS